MNAGEAIVRIAARGDGVTAEGRHVPLSVPGDRVLADGSLRHGPHHATPPCRHFGMCGGCQLQHCDDWALAQFVTDRVANAARSQGLEIPALAPAHLSPPASRRRAALHAVNGRGRPLIGYRQAGSHRLVDLGECPVLRPELLAVLDGLRTLLAGCGGKYSARIELTLADQGIDCGIGGVSFVGLRAAESLLVFARGAGLARLTLDEGFGPETRWEPLPVTVTLGGVAVPLPPGAFLQATADGEAALTAAAREWLAGAFVIVDLFSGLGTFAFALAGPARVWAVEGARDAHLACRAAAERSGRPVLALHRDLFRNPLQAEELNRFDAVLLDPPRAGAREQVRQIARSAIARVVYVSCNPSSWARDARMLVDAGFRLGEVRPVGQFRWSTEVELASQFERG